MATQKNASSIVKGIEGNSLTFGPQGEVQHVTEVVNRSTLLAGCQVFEKKFDKNLTAWYSGGLTLENLAEEVVTLASTLALRSREVDPGCEERPSAFARPDICLLHNFHIGTELHACDGRSDCV